MEEERVWVGQALAGDQVAFGRLVEAYKTPVFNLAYRLLGDAAEAEDAAQETFVRVYTHLNTYDPDRKFSSWILSITSHYCIDRLRRRRSSWLSLDDLLTRRTFADPHDGPEKTALQREEQDAVNSLLADLPSQYRLVLILRYWQDLSYQEMSQVLGTTESAIKSLLHRARCLLAERIRVREVQSDARTSSYPEDSSSWPLVNSKMEAVRNALPTSD